MDLTRYSKYDLPEIFTINTRILQFITSLHYQVSLVQVDRCIPEHLDYLNAQYMKGHFILSGRKEPFHREGLVRYKIAEMVPIKALQALDLLF